MQMRMAMAGVMTNNIKKALLPMLVLVIVLVAAEGPLLLNAQVHHVVGGDRGWDLLSDIASWSASRIFRVGDKIWFTYSAARESIVELRSKEEFEACDVSNPIRMYTDGLDSLHLDQVGIRYFASGNPKSCKNGLKLHVEVQPQDNYLLSDGSSREFAAAAGPAPSASTPLKPNNGLRSYALFGGVLLGYLCF